MKTLIFNILLLLFLLQPFGSKCQTYGNEWINYNQSYFSFKIVQDGIYRIDYSTLNAAGIPLSTFQSENIQIFGRESEIPIHVVDGGDSQINPGDYFIFYAQRNDAWLDSTIYKDPTTLANPAYSLYNDTIQYFFTWNNSTNNYRYQVETDVNYGSYSSITDYILFKHESSYSNAYHDGEKIKTATSSFNTPGEGWGSVKVNGAAGAGYTANLSASTPLPYTGPSAPLVQFHGRSVSQSNANNGGQPNHHLRWLFGTSSTVLLDSIFIGYKQITIDATIPASALTNGNTPIKWNIVNDLGAASDYQAYNYFSVIYPRLPDFSGANDILFEVKNDTQGKIRLDISNAGYANPIMFVHGDTPMMIPFELNGGVHSALIPNSLNGQDQTVIYKDTSLIIDINSLTGVGPSNNGTFTDFTAIPGALEDGLLFVYHDKLITATMNYAAYRSSLAGGNYNVVMANVEELYMQFGGGIEKHINGVRRFAHYIYNNTTNKPVGLFLIGKGIRESTYNSILSDGPGTRNDPMRFAESLIPSFGQPSSDICITAGLEGSFRWAPLMATGRISTRTDIELQDYLDKIIANEQEQDPTSIYDTPSKDWQKQIMHFTGGSDAAQQNQFQGYMNQFELTIEDSLFGGNTNRVYKVNSDPLDPTVLSGITDRISQGTSILNYFGHASATTSGFEINLDDPSTWNNAGKNPLMIANSCYNGNIFQLGNSNSEDFVQTPNYGAIAYLAAVNVGFDVYLYIYTKQLYKHFSYLNYGKTLGGQLKANIESLETPSDNFYLETTCTQMVLNGDPMYKINSHENPEIELLNENISFSPNTFDLTVDSIEMSIIITNLGRSVIDTFSLEVIRNFPSSSVDSIYFFQIPKLDYKDTFTFKMPLQPNIGTGINTFNITVDLPTKITEQYDEINNNQITKALYINIDGIVPVIPYEFAVVPKDSVTVKGSTINPIADFNTYRFEIDTTDLFNSPEHRFAYVSGLGGVKEVNPSEWASASTGLNSPLICTDSTVYFWRVAIDSSTYDWRESSFQYITDREGWGQDHFFQFKKNGFFGVDYDRPTRTRQFGPFTRQLNCDVYSAAAVPTIYDNSWYIDGTLQDYGICTWTPQIQVAVIDPVTLESWGTRYLPWNENLGNDFGNYNDNGACRPRPEKIFLFSQSSPADLTAFQDMVNNQVPDGHYLLIYTPIAARYDLWNSIDSTNMYNTFTALGSDSINGNRINAPFAFFVKKGDPSSVVELYAPSPTGDVHLTANLVGNDYEGSETTPLIGPASAWGNVYWKQDPEETSSVDSTILRIKAYDLGGAFQHSIDTMFTLNDSIINLNNIFDATIYPFISLEGYYNDTTTNTPAQIDRWHVLFSPMPEAAIDGTNLYTWSIPSDTLQEGQEIDFAVDIKNIFTVDMDSLLVRYWIEDANQNKHFLAYARQDSLRVNEVLRDTITFSTAGFGGINSLWVEVNPYVNGNLYETDQPEQLHFNNLLQIPFKVIPDDINPILDVTFNGNHILNGDIIDPNSEILISLKDDNEFLIMDNVADTALFGVYLTTPAGNQTKIPFINGNGDIVMQWIPAEQQHKRFKIIWPAGFDMDGTYTLFIQGTDKSGNISGDLEYRVSFEIIHESTITQMMNYPNPFSTSTRFVFTLTGTEVPDDIIIQIMTVSGRVVREITEDELGLIQIGRNITEYAWNGTDEFGDPLANGVYLYRVKAKINGEDIKQRESGADQYFTKNFGKMYLMR